MAANCASNHAALADIIMISRSMAADCISIRTALADGAGRSMAADCASIHTALAVRWLMGQVGPWLLIAC